MRLGVEVCLLTLRADDRPSFKICIADCKASRIYQATCTIYSRILLTSTSELRVPKIGGFPLTLIVALTTVLRTTVLHCDMTINGTKLMNSFYHIVIS